MADPNSNPRVFISWSGDQSKVVAEALSRWLPDVFNQIDVWMSAHHIEAGSRWSNELQSNLSNTNIGILCLTPDNLNANWVLYEAGSLAKEENISRVIPYLTGLKSTDLNFPLAQFQAVENSRKGSFELVKSINKCCKINLPDDRVSRIFDRWWPDLESEMQIIPQSLSEPRKTKGDREILEEILNLVRTINRNDQNPNKDLFRVIHKKKEMQNQFNMEPIKVIINRLGRFVFNKEVFFVYDSIVADLLLFCEKSSLALELPYRVENYAKEWIITIQCINSGATTLVKQISEDDFNTLIKQLDEREFDTVKVDLQEI